MERALPCLRQRLFPLAGQIGIGGGGRGASVANVGFAAVNPGRAMSALGREQPLALPDSSRSMCANRGIGLNHPL